MIKTHQKVSFRQWLNLVFVYSLIPFVLFVCAWDFSWWQGWVYAAIILGVGIGGRIWAEARHPGLTAERQNRDIIKQAKSWDKVLAPLMAISISYPMVLVAGLDHRFAWSPEFSIWLNAVGFLLIAIGYIFASWAVAENRFFFSVVCIQVDRGHVVCDTGPYRMLRHPGYAGNLFALLGIVLALSSYWTLMPALIAGIVTVIRTRLEDRTLQEELSGYSEYAKRVRFRLIPGVY